MKKFFIRFFIVALCQAKAVHHRSFFFFFPSLFNFLILVFLRHLRSNFLQTKLKRVKNYGNYLSAQNVCNIGNFPKLNHFLPALSAFLDALKFLFCKFHPFCGVECQNIGAFVCATFLISNIFFAILFVCLFYVVRFNRVMS